MHIHANWLKLSIYKVWVLAQILESSEYDAKYNSTKPVWLFYPRDEVAKPL